VTSDAPPLSASLEDYLETIYLIVAEKKVARAKEIAGRLKVSRSSVTEAFRSLAQKGLINYAPYEVITLTAAGMAAAEDIIRRHQTLKDFFTTVLAVDDRIAEEGACRIEHSAPPEIIDRLIDFMRFIRACPRGGEEWIDGFKHHCSNAARRTDCRRCITNCLEK